MILETWLMLVTWIMDDDETSPEKMRTSSVYMPENHSDGISGAFKRNTGGARVQNCCSD